MFGFLISAALGFFGGWLGKALHLQTKTAAKVDQILGASPGTGQAVLDLAGQSLLTAAQNAATKPTPSNTGLPRTTP